VSRVLERVTVTGYVTPLREGGSLPGLVEADNLGTYVLKFRGAGHGSLARVAEIIAGEIQDLLRASEGLNLAVDFLPGAAGFDPLGWTADEEFASEVLWFDALIQNVDRTWRNPNLLVWHGDIWLIDHGAALSAFERACTQGPLAERPLGERFRWLTAPRSGIVQPGPVHGGITTDPAADLDRLFASLVSS
jgi:Protein of unknown function (DUF3037)